MLGKLPEGGGGAYTWRLGEIYRRRYFKIGNHGVAGEIDINAATTRRRWRDSEDLFVFDAWFLFLFRRCGGGVDGAKVRWVGVG